MFEEDQDTLAAEYVLGTLSAEEREHAEALLSFDPGFETAVRQWERRLGELNVMVEAVEPPTELWDKIKKEIAPDAVHTADVVSAAEASGPHDLDALAVGAAASDFRSPTLQFRRRSPQRHRPRYLLRRRRSPSSRGRSSVAPTSSI